MKVHKLKSNAKININLNITGKSASKKIHFIESLVVFINLSDLINIQETNYKSHKVIFKGRFYKGITKKNTVIKLLNLLDKKKLLGKKKYKIVIKKNIPVFAGLGGGTANSASVIKYFMKNKINERYIRIFEKVIGSDFRLFLYKSSFQKKIAKVNKSRNKINYPFLIIYPNLICKTKNIYKLNKNLSSSSRNLYYKKYSKKNFIEKIKKDRNDLQSIVEKKYPKISKLIQDISIQKGCIFSRMTGSGSACYGVFQSKKSANFAMVKLKRKYPKYWCVITKTI